MTRNAIVDRDAALNLIDELRVAVPEEVRAAKRINSEGERIIEKAQEEAERIVARAQEQAAFLIGERGLTEAAMDESRRIIAEAEGEADQVRGGADAYAAGVLAALESEVTRTLHGIERGIATLDERRASYALPEAVEPDVSAPYAPDLVDEIDDREQGASPAVRR
jgi:cell division septum initiation protein DivIVA